jgi:hypothetical protein
MATKHFDCENCGAHGKITYKETTEFGSSDIAFCPFCGADIYEDEDTDDEQED